MSTLAVVLTTIVLVGAVLGVIHRLIVKPTLRLVVAPVVDLVHKVNRIFDALYGEPARLEDGLVGVPGLIERQASIQAQMTVNGTGLQLGDAVAQALKATDRIEAKADKAALAATTAKDLVVEVKREHDEAKAAATEERAEISARLEPLEEWVRAGQEREATYRDSLREIHDIRLDHPQEGTE